MTIHRLDTLARTLAGKRSRRTALRATGAGIVAGLLGSTAGTHAVAHDATPESTAADVGEDGAFLFVQTATSGSFQPNPQAGTPDIGGTPTPGGGADYLLTLEGHSGGTIYFSDRPDRIFGDAPTQQFLDGLGFSPVNPPNAALVAQTQDGTEDVIVLELLGPTYDAAAGSVTYGANILSEYEGDGLTHVASQQQDAELPASFDGASLFIDDCSDITDCVLYDLTAMPPVQVLGPVPGGPYGSCWSWSNVSCEPCSDDQSYLNGLCDSTYDCPNNQCKAQ